MEMKRLVVPIGQQFIDVSVEEDDVKSARLARGLSGPIGPLEWHFVPFERLVTDDPPQWQTDASTFEILEARTSEKTIRVRYRKLRYAWRATLGVYQLHERTDALQTVLLAAVEVRTNSPIHETMVLSSQNTVVSLSFPLGHTASGTPAKWLLFDMDSTMSTRRALLPIVQACNAIADALTMWIAGHNPNKTFALSLSIEAAGRTVQWANYPLGARLWTACNDAERAALLALISRREEDANPKECVRLDLGAIGSVYFDPAPNLWEPPATLGAVSGVLNQVFKGATEMAVRYAQALFIHGSRLSDHPAPSLRLLASASSQIKLNLGAAEFRRRSSSNGQKFDAPLNFYVLAYAGDAQVVPSAVFAVHALPNAPFPVREFTEATEDTVLEPGVVVGDVIYRPIFDSNDANWMNNPTGNSRVELVAVPSASALAVDAAFYGTNTALATPMKYDTKASDLSVEWGLSSLLLTVEERKDPQLTLLLGDKWPYEEAGGMKSTPYTKAIALGDYDVGRTGLFGRRIRAVEEIRVLTARTRPAFVAPELPIEFEPQSKLEPDSVLREATLKALNSVRLNTGNTDFIADTLPEWGRPYAPGERVRAVSEHTLALDPRVTKYPRLGGTAYPEQPSFADASRAAAAVERMAKMTYEEWMNTNPVLRDALFDPLSGKTSRASQVELDTYIRRVALLLEDPANGYDPKHHLQASLVGGRLKDSLAWLRMLEANSGAITAPQWLARPALGVLHPDTILQRYEKTYPTTGLGWEARNDIREFHLPKVQGALLKMGAALTDQVSADIRKWATENTQVTTMPGKLAVVADDATKRPPVLLPYIPRRPGPAMLGPVKPPTGFGIAYDPLFVIIERVAPAYKGKLRDNGWSQAAQLRLAIKISKEKWSNDRIRDFMAKVEAVTFAPSPVVDNAVAKAFEAVIGKSVTTIQQRAAEIAERLRRAEEMLREKIENARQEMAGKLAELYTLEGFVNMLGIPRLDGVIESANSRIEAIRTATDDDQVDNLTRSAVEMIDHVREVYHEIIAGEQAQLREDKRIEDEFSSRIRSALSRVSVAAGRLRAALSKLRSVDDYPDDDADQYGDFVSPNAQLQLATVKHDIGLENPRYRADEVILQLGAIEKNLNANAARAEAEFAKKSPPSSGVGSVSTALEQSFFDVFGPPLPVPPLLPPGGSKPVPLSPSSGGSEPVPPSPSSSGSGSVSDALDGALADVFGSSLPVLPSSPPGGSESVPLSPSSGGSEPVPPSPSSGGSGSVSDALDGALADVFGPPLPVLPSSIPGGSEPVSEALSGAFADVFDG